MGVLGIVGDASADNDGFGRYETKRLWQYRVEFFPAFEGSALASLLTPTVQRSLTVAARTVSRPTVTFNEMVINHGNEQWKLSGKTNWASENTEIVFDDVIPQKASGAGDEDAQFSVSAIIYDWQNLQQNIITGAAGLSKDYKANIVVTQFAPDETEIERFVYHGAWPNNRSGDAHDYTSEDGNTLTISFTVDKIFRVEAAPGNIFPPVDILGTSDET